MKPEDIQHGGNHYKDQPKHLQPIYLATALKLNPIEYSILKYLLRHRKKGGLLDVQKMMHFAQMLWEENHGQSPQITYLTPAVGVEFEFHKQQPDAPFASLLQLLGFQITNAECAILQCLLRHKSNGKVCELRELLQYGQWLIYSEYGMVAVLKQLGEPIDAEFEIVPPADPPQVECPFKIGDIIQHHMDIEDQAGAKWQIVGITSEQLLVVNFHDHNDASHIERRFWRNYSRVGTASTEAKNQPGCPFKVGDIIAKPNSTGWQIDRILSDRLHVISHDPYQTPSQIDRQFWGNYRIVVPTTLDATQQTC